MNDTAYLFLIGVVGVIGLYIIFVSGPKSKKKADEEALTIVKENKKLTKEYEISVYSNETLEQIVDEINLQNKRIIKITNRTWGTDTIITDLIIN